MTFRLDERLRADTLPKAFDLPLCNIRCFDDQRFAWVVLVPRVPDAVEIMDLTPNDYEKLTREIRQVSAGLKATTSCDKINIAAFGNMVPQLHIHIVARMKDDPAWPGSAIGFEGKVRYEAEEAPNFFKKLTQEIALTH